MIFTRPGLRGALLAALALFSLFVTPTHAQPRIPGAPIPFDPTVGRGTLDNGVRYYIKRNAEPAARAHLWLAVRAGAVYEEDDQRGLARFVARMAFRGTERYSAQQIAEYLASIGGSPVPDEHVQTGFDATVFHLEVPAGSPEALKTGIEMLGEWAFAIAFPADGTRQERELILADWDNAADVDRQLSALFGDSRYAERRPGGRREVIESAGPEQLAAFYERWYRPDRMALIAVGDFDPEAVESTVRGHFSQPAQGAGEAGRSAFAIPDHDEPRVSVITDPEAGAAHLTLSRKLGADTRADVTAYRNGLMQRLVDAMINARLAERQQAGRAYLSAGVGRTRLTPDADLWIATAQVERGGVERGLQALLEELRRAQVHGFTEAEVERNKTALARAVQDAYETRDRRPSHLLAEEYMRHFLEGGSYPGLERERELHRLLLPDISSEDLHGWAAGNLPSGSAANTVLLVTEPPAGAEGAADGGGADAATRETRLRDQLIAAAALQVEPYDDSTHAGSADDGSADDGSADDGSADGGSADGGSADDGSAERGRRRRGRRRRGQVAGRRAIAREHRGGTERAGDWRPPLDPVQRDRRGCQADRRRRRRSAVSSHQPRRHVAGGGCRLRAGAHRGHRGCRQRCGSARRCRAAGVSRRQAGHRDALHRRVVRGIQRRRGGAGPGDPVPAHLPVRHASARGRPRLRAVRVTAARDGRAA